MFDWVYKLFGKVRGKNAASTPVAVISDQLKEPRPLPMGVKEFHRWADRIIGGALIPGADHESQKFAIANMILHLGPTESHKEDAFFIHMLRKVAINQVAHQMMVDMKAAATARQAELEAENAKRKAEEDIAEIAYAVAQEAFDE